MTSTATLSLLIDRPNGFKSYEVGQAQLVWKGKSVTYMLFDCGISEEIRLFREESTAQVFVNKFGAYLRQRLADNQGYPTMIEFLAYGGSPRKSTKVSKTKKGAKQQ